MGSSPGLPLAPSPPPRRPHSEEPLLEASVLSALNQRRNGPALRQVAFHLAVLLIGGLAWSIPLRGSWPWGGSATGWWVWPLGIVGLLALGWGLAFAFCAMHECGHRTAFANRALNDAVAWWAGVLSFYNADFYRRYHQWHHRFTHLPGFDPELEDPPPAGPWSYGLELSGISWWIGKLRGHLAGLRGDIAAKPYIGAEAAPAVRRSLTLQFLVYGSVALASLPGSNGFLFWYWLLPLAVGQPLLRFVLLAEHGGCPCVDDGLRNTRTTLTLAPLRLLMWNMPFHAEHHLYPSLPFHALARAHQHLAARLAVISPGYLAVHRAFIEDFSCLAVPAAASPPGSAAELAAAP